MTRIVKFDAVEHEGHSVWGVETSHYAGPMYLNGDGDWHLGNNRSDSDLLVWEVEGCYDCDVEFRQGRTVGGNR